MGLGDTRLATDRGRELAGHGRNREQHEHRDDVVRIIDPEREVRCGEEEIVGKRGDKRREERGS